MNCLSLIWPREEVGAGILKDILRKGVERWGHQGEFSKLLRGGCPGLEHTLSIPSVHTHFPRVSTVPATLAGSGGTEINKAKLQL